MALRASQTRIIAKKYLIGFVSLGTLLPFIGLVFGIWKVTNQPLTKSSLENCMNIEGLTQTSLRVVISSIVSGSGLYCDIKMLLLVKNTNAQ